MNFKIVNLSISVIVVIACLIFAYSLITTDALTDHPYYMVGPQRIILECILVAYSIFRGYRVYKAFREKES